MSGGAALIGSEGRVLVVVVMVVMMEKQVVMTIMGDGVEGCLSW